MNVSKEEIKQIIREELSLVLESRKASAPEKNPPSDGDTVSK